MHVVSLINQKGGCAKSTTCFHASADLARRGFRVLLVDGDPQGSLTQGFLGPTVASGFHPGATVAALYGEDDPAPWSLIVQTAVPRVSLVPGSIDMTAHNTPHRSEWPPLERRLREFLEDVADDFDVCLIDTPPNLHLCTRSALVASDFLVVPTQAEDFGSQGLAPVARAVEDARRVNPGLTLAGYLLTMIDKRLTVHTTYEAMLRERYGDAVFTATVPRAKDFIEAVAMRQPVGVYKPRGTAAKASDAVTAEIMARIGLAPGKVVAA